MQLETATRTGALQRRVKRFYFHLYDDMIAIDEEGQELPSLQAAREKALTDARQMACAEVLEGHLNLKHRIDVADGDGNVMTVVRFKDAVELEG